MTKKENITVVFSILLLLGLMSVSQAKEKSDKGKEVVAPPAVSESAQIEPDASEGELLSKEDENFLDEDTEKKLEEADEGVGDVAPPIPPTIWEQFPPDVQVYLFGQQFRIQVTANPEMPKGSVGAIESIKIEKTDGTFLGYRPFNASEPRQALFMTDPKKIESKEAKLTITSSVDGEWSEVVSLENPATAAKPIVAPEPEAPKAAPHQAPAKEEGKKPKKKFFLW